MAGAVRPPTLPFPEPRLVTAPPARLVGMHRTASFMDSPTADLWRRFMPRRAEPATAGPELYAVDVFPADFFLAFDPEAPFEKWAAVRVSDDDTIPDGMADLTLPGGLHAVFTYRGPASRGPAAYRYIYGDWLPASAYVLADRPHFAVMGEKYRGEDPESEEELWIPVRPRIT